MYGNRQSIAHNVTNLSEQSTSIYSQCVHLSEWRLALTGNSTGLRFAKGLGQFERGVLKCEEVIFGVHSKH